MKKILNKFNFKKTVAVFTALAFVFTCIFGNTAFASMGSSMPAINTINFDIPIIPTSLGKITSAKYFDSEDIIINIQDLHCHAETQRKIASIIGYIDSTYNLNNVYLEGAFNTVDTSWLSSFNNNQNGTKILEGLVDSGKLSGTEYYSIINNKKNFVLGIEDEALYKENIKLLGSILSLQPEVNAICAQLEKEISKIKRDYSSRQARKLEKIIKSFKNKEIDAKYYYSQLTTLAEGCNLSVDKYPNIKIYISLLDKAQYLNNRKVVYEFSKFVTEMKNVLPYQQYCDLLKKSNNFNSLDDISAELIELDKKYSITNKLELTNFKNFLTYLEFNQNINPVKLIQEEESFINELYVKLGRTKYEKEVAFMFDFIPTIEKYFSADISADEYYKFEQNYNLFKTIWPSYFSLNVLKNLEQYQKLLSRYHKNNITRDQIFAESLITQKNLNNSVRVSDTNLAIKTIKSNLNNKKIKLVVTGGFHTRGLEKIFEQQKISYVIITPKITQPIEQAKQTYIDNVMYYSNILKNTINLEPLTQEPLNISFPKIMNLIFSEVQKNSIFEEYSKQDTKQAIKQFIQEYIISKQSDFYGQVEILNWDIISENLTGNIEFVVSYKDNANKQMVSTVRYKFADGNIIPYASVDVQKTRTMLERITNNKYAQPSIELEPANAVRKKIAKHILEPLQKVAGKSVSLMPAEQLHMTIGYDSTPMTQQQIDSLVEESDISADIFSVLDILDEDFVNSKVAMAGTLKLMPDGVIIYEITDKDLLKQMFGLRTTLLNADSKYKTPSIVHMSIGRISDMKLLNDSEQSKQELAELLEKINETIYEINKKNALSKIKTAFTLKSGYVSSTGDKDYVYRRVLPKKESLVVFGNLVDSAKTKANLIYKVIVAPIIEELVFRALPFVITGLVISNPAFVVPAIVTGVVSILGFSLAHPLADRINNYFYEKIEQGKITNKFIAKLFTAKVPVRKMRSFLFQSVSLTYIFLAISFVFPQTVFFALAVSFFYHSLNNFLVLKQGEDKIPLLNIIQGHSQDNEQTKNIYAPEYQSLFSFVPKDVLDFENSTKYFETSKEEQTKNLDVSKEKELALDRLLKNGDLALEKVSHSAEDLKIAIGFIEKMLQDLKLISSYESRIGYLEDKFKFNKENIEKGDIEAVFQKPIAVWLSDMRIYTLISEIKSEAVSEVKNVSDKFEAFEKVLENNEYALSSLANMREDSVNDTIYFIEEMIDSFEIIDPTSAQKAKISLLNIKKNIKEGNVKIEELSVLKPWQEEDIDKVKELHTLINVVHQTSTRKLMANIKHSSNAGARKVVLKQDGNEQLSFYDCTKGPMKNEMKDFFAALSDTDEKIHGNYIVKDNKLLYSNQLGFHGVNILVDMEEGIRVTFNESIRGDGNALRITLLATLFAQSGFDIANADTRVEYNSATGVCSFTAVCSLKNDFNAPEKYAVLFSQAMKILLDTKDLDYDLEDGNDPYSKDHYYFKYYIPKLTLEDYRKMKNSFDMPEEFTKGTTGRLVTRWKEKSAEIKQIKNKFEKTKQEEKNKFLKLYDYLGMDADKASPWEIVSEYIKGKLIINENGELERNTEYDVIDSLLDAIETNTDDALKQSQVINSLNPDSFHYETEGYIGGMVALSGLLRLDGKGWLSIKTAVDKERKRSKFAYVEFVDFNGDRTRLNYKELIKILQDFGYAVKEQKSRFRSEREDSLTVLREKILFPKDGIYTRGMSVSGQADKYIPVKITYDKNNVDENSMWIVSYTSPEDVATIIKSGAIMTTSGGMLSHANITARENNKTAILSNGQWVDGKLVVPYFSIESPIDGQKRRGYEIQKIAEHNLVLEEGDVVLANGINGRVLVYNAIAKKTIADIQKAIDENDLGFISKYIETHSRDKNIRQVVEYIFLQVNTDKEKQKITDYLLGFDKRSEIGIKVSELNKVYTGEKIKAINKYIKNEKKIKDANIRLAVINFIEQELLVLEYSLKKDDDAVNEMKDLLDTVTKDKQAVLSKRGDEVRKTIKKISEILNKKNITEQEKDELVKISERAKVWNYYENYEMKISVARIDKIISMEEGKDYETEIRGFEDIEAKDVVRYGTKTTELAKLFGLFKKLKITIATVPYGMGISKDVLRIFFERNGLADKYLQLMKEFQQAIKAKDKEKAIETGKQISELIESLDDEQLESYIKSKLEDGKKYAVRSSGVGEDGANHAFAGMAKTELNVNKDNVYSYVKEGWKSFFTDTCVEDMVKAGIVVQPALLIQEMVSGVQKAGVIFTRDNSGNLTIEGVCGLGEGLVSGRITPDHVTVRASDEGIEYRRALNNMIKIEEKAEGGIKVTKLTEEEKIERILDENTIKQLKEVATLLEEDAGYPVDIEFAIDKAGKIFVLQRRAITTLAKQEKSKSVSEPVIKQSLIDKTIEDLSKLSSYSNQIPAVIKKLSNLPEDEDNRNMIVINQIIVLVDVLKNIGGNYFYKDNVRDGSVNEKLIPIIMPFLKLDKDWFEETVKSLFYNDADKKYKRDHYKTLEDIGIFIKEAYLANPEFVDYIVKTSVSEQLLKQDERMPYIIENGLGSLGYNAIKQYYFAMASYHETDNNLAKILLESINKMKKNILPGITDNKTKENINGILVSMEELAGKINIGSIPLLEILIGDLFNEALILKNTDKTVSLQIIETIFSVCKRIMSKSGNLDSSILDAKKVKNVLIEEYDKHSDSDFFNNMISQLVSLIQQKQDNEDDNSVSKIITDMLIEVALYVYKPISSKKIKDVDSKKYQTIKNLTFDIFGKLASKRPEDSAIYNALFNNSHKDRNIEGTGIGFNPETLKLFTDAVKKNKYTLPIYLPDDAFISGDIELLTDMITDSIQDLNPVYEFQRVFSEDKENLDDWDDDDFEVKEKKDKAKKLSILLIEKMLSLANDETVALKTRRRIVSVLMFAISEGLYKDNNKEISIDFEQVKSLAEQLKIPAFLHRAGVSQYYNDGIHTEYTFTPLIKSLPENISKANPLGSRYGGSRIYLEKENPVLTKIVGKTNASNPEVNEAISRFEVLQTILKSNRTVLLSLDNIKNSKDYDKDIDEILKELQKMINELKKINIEHGTAAEKAWEKVKFSLKNSDIDIKEKEKRHLLISKWDSDGLEYITGLHTLINAVHQTAIADFKAEIGNVKEGKALQIITASQKSEIRGYNLSDTANSNIVKFFSKLATKSLPNNEIDDFICKDDLVVWSTILNVHSVDIFFNFSEVDRGISIYYRESLSSSRDVGKEERLRYFREILRNLGFFVEEPSSDVADPYSLKATLNKNFGMNDNMDLIDIATHVVEIFKFSTNVDYDLKLKKKQSGYEEVFKNWIEKAKRRELWFGFQPNNSHDIYGYGHDAINLDRLPNKKLLNIESLNAILEYLGCDLLPEDTTERKLTNSTYLNEHFNKPIERAYVEGRIIFDENGVLVRNENYDITRSIIDEINNNFDETIKQSRTVNLVNSYEFDTKILANIGKFVVVSSVMELETGDKLFVKAAMDPNTKRMKYAIAEKVTAETRQKLTNEELVALLAREGYEIPWQEAIRKREKKKTKSMLSRKIQFVESQKSPATPVSEGTGVSIAGNITFDKNKIDENSIWLVPYTTPEDIESIEKAKGIITTGGGVLSHAAITTKELKKPSVVLNGSTWTSDANNEVEILYSMPSGDVKQIDEYYVQEVKTARKTIKEGSRVLMNGETGIVLLFDDIKVDLLNELQEYIDKDDSTAVIKFMNRNSDQNNINRFVEYVYFQVVGNPKTQNVLDCLFFDTMPETVKDKVNKLNDVYIQDKVQSISEAIENIKHIDNPNTANTILLGVEAKLKSIKTIGTNDDIENLKTEIENLKQINKEKFSVFIHTFVDSLLFFASKKHLNEYDIKDLNKMLKYAEVYDYFVTEDETSEYLLQAKEQIKNLIKEIKERDDFYDTVNQDNFLEKEICPFEDIVYIAGNDKIFGSKTVELARMYKMPKGGYTFEVPGGVGIGVDVLPMLLESVGQESLLFEFYNAIENKNREQALAFKEKIEKFLETDIQNNTDIERKIMERIYNFINSNAKYSVRSSGVGEDGATNAFAGMGETELNVECEDIYKNIIKCWKAFFSEKSIDYMITSGQIVKPAVLVQRMIYPDVSGVAFSRDRYGNGRINAVFGLGEGIVSGKLTPDSISFDVDTNEVIEYSVANKEFKFVADDVEKTKKVPVEEGVKTRALGSFNLDKLARAVKKLEKAAGYPIDIEFAVIGYSLYILQLRPITTLGNNKEQVTEMPGAGSVIGEQKIQEQETVEAKYGISLNTGKIVKNKTKKFVNIANPLDNTESISVYLKSVDSQVTEFIVEPKYADMVKSGLLGKLLLGRINSDPAVLSKLNAGVFNYKAGEIELLPILDEDVIEKTLSEDMFDIGIDNVKNILASA